MNAPAPKALAHPRLRVVETEQRPQQDCARCRLLQTCWDPQLKPDGVVINLLVCRLKLGLDREQTARTLLELIKPKVRRVARWTRRKIGSSEMTLRDYVAVIQSVAIESLSVHYVLGSHMHPMLWLFVRPFGAVTLWAQQHIRTVRRDRSRVIHLESMSRSGLDDIDEKIRRANSLATNRQVQAGPPGVVFEPIEFDARFQDRARAAHILTVLDDGVSLSVDEYRVLAFCLSNAHAGRHATDGLHLALANVMKVPRSRITRIYGVGLRKLLDASGEAARFLRARGIETQAVTSQRRRVRTLRNGRDELSAEEVIEVLALRAKGGVSIQDLVWIYGVTEHFLRRVIQRFDGLTPNQVQEVCYRA